MSTKDVIGRGGKESSYADADSWGYRLAAGMTYSNVLRAVNLRPRVVWSHDVNGNSPAPTGQFFEGKKAVSVGLGVDYLNRKIQGQISYTSFFGGGRHNVYQDRDFVNFSLSYSF
jgi:hypothetical protein